MMGTPESVDQVGAAWRADRAYLVNLVFRMMGDVGEAEEIVQEAFIRFADRTDERIDDARGWLTVVTGRLCLDHLRSARYRRERARDTSLLEQDGTLHRSPVDPADRITLDDTVHTALSLVLRRLSPAERVVFILHDVFTTPFDEIAATVGRTPTGCRQLARRARQKIASVPLRLNEVSSTYHDKVTETFITACGNGDLDALVAVLDPDVWGMADFSAVAGTSPRINHGVDAVATALIHHFGSGTILVTSPACGQPTVLAFRNRKPFAVIVLTVVDGVIRKVHVTADQSTED